MLRFCVAVELISQLLTTPSPAEGVKVSFALIKSNTKGTSI